MIELNPMIDEFIGGNWLAILVVLTFLKSVAKQTGWRPVQILYRTLNKCFEVLRPNSDIPVSPPKPKKPTKDDK